MELYLCLIYWYRSRQNTARGPHRDFVRPTAGPWVLPDPGAIGPMAHSAAPGCAAGLGGSTARFHFLTILQAVLAANGPGPMETRQDSQAGPEAQAEHTALTLAPALAPALAHPMRGWGRGLGSLQHLLQTRLSWP